MRTIKIIITSLGLWKIIIINLTSVLVVNYINKLINLFGLTTNYLFYLLARNKFLS